jgi:mannose-6-phosphate isomerase-like protein (cupin superfamily)
MEKVVEKEWGQELWVANNEEANYCGKILTINPGKGFSMHFHDIKVETFFIGKGWGTLWTIDLKTGKLSNEILSKNKVVHIPRLKPHQIINDHPSEILEIFEFSTFHRDEDSYRVWREIPNFVTK